MTGLRHLVTTLVLLSASAVQAQASTNDSEVWYLRTPDNVRHFVIEQGRGPTVVVIHGGYGAEHSYLLDAVRPLRDHYRLVLYDQRGSLRSPAPPESISQDALVADLEALRQQIGEAQLTLLTHSMGAATAMAYLARYPDRVRGLVLTAPVFPVWVTDVKQPPDNEEFIKRADRPAAKARYAAYWKKVENRVNETLVREGLTLEETAPAESIRTPGLQKRLTRQWRIRFAGNNLYHLERWRSMPGGMAFYNQKVGDAILSDEAAVKRSWSGFIPALKRFDGPVSIVLGDADYADPDGVLWRKLSAKLRRGRVEILADAGHAYWIDQPDAAAQALTRALDASMRAN